MNKITASTTDEQIKNATKAQIVNTLFTGLYARLRSSRMAKWSKKDAIQEAVNFRNNLRK